MAYSPLDQGALADDAALQALAERQGCSTAQLALAWLLAQAGVNALPKAVGEAHLRELSPRAAALKWLEPVMTPGEAR
mgnify:CR=1 FL=1